MKDIVCCICESRNRLRVTVTLRFIQLNFGVFCEGEPEGVYFTLDMLFAVFTFLFGFGFGRRQRPLGPMTRGDDR